MVKLESVTTTPTFSDQLENKILYSNHVDDISISYKSTYTLKYIIEGSKQYNFNDQNITISKNQYLILNTKSKITTEAKKGTKGLSFFLSPKLMDEIYGYYAHSSSPIEFLEVPRKKSNSNMDLLLDKIACLYEQNKIAYDQQIDNLFIRISELVVEEQTNLDTKFMTLKIVKQSTKKELFKLITLAKEYLNDNISESISLDMISKDVGISKYYLHRLFTEINGSTPYAYLMAIRLEKAKNQLQYSKNSILEIAIACGFDNTSYFSNTFKKHIGLSPSQFRKKI